MKRPICYMCEYCYVKSQRNEDISREGFCYANPPTPGFMYPKVKLNTKACRHFVQAYDKKTTEKE